MLDTQSLPVSDRRLAAEQLGEREVVPCPLVKPLAVPKPCKLQGAIAYLIALSSYKICPLDLVRASDSPARHRLKS